MRSFRYFAWVILAGLLLSPLRLWAAELNVDWQHAASLGRNPVVISAFGQLSGSGSVRFFRFTTTAPEALTATVAVDSSAGNNLSPRLVLYKPDQVTVGPILPMSQPPSTIASVYPATGTDMTREGPWLSSLTHSISSSLDIPTTGTYYLAVYNAGTHGGAFRLTVQQSSTVSASFSSRMRTWWDTGVWVGPQPSTYVFPIGAALLAGLVWYVVHRLPHPATKRRRVYVKK